MKETHKSLLVDCEGGANLRRNTKHTRRWLGARKREHFCTCSWLHSLHTILLASIKVLFTYLSLYTGVHIFFEIVHIW